MAPAATANQITRALPWTRRPASAASPLSRAAPTNTGAHAVRPGTAVPPLGVAMTRKTAIPAATATAPIPSPRVSRRCCLRAISGSTNSTSSEASGWTRASGPNPRATARMKKDSASRPIPASQSGWRARSSSSRRRSTSSAPDARATVCCTREACGETEGSGQRGDYSDHSRHQAAPFCWPI